MISYEEIANRLGNIKIKLNIEDDEVELADIADAPYYKQPLLNIPPCSTAKGAEKKWREGLSKILTFIKRHQYVQKKCSMIYVSTRSKTNHHIWGVTQP